MTEHTTTEQNQQMYPLVRPATVHDVPEILHLIHELAAYEREPDAVKTTVESLTESLFGESPKVFAHIVECSTDDGPSIAGFAVWYITFSTWVGKHGIYLEDLYVHPQFRGSGCGKALLEELRRICTQRDYGRLEWACLDWNQSAIDFYKSLGAESMDDWTVFRLSGEALGTRDTPRGTSTSG